MIPPDFTGPRLNTTLENNVICNRAKKEKSKTKIKSHTQTPEKLIIIYN
jgi:hypothetical protein